MTVVTRSPLLLLLSIGTVAATLECSTGFGSETMSIPDQWINDGYCDCPLDGADEPNTSACSGATVGGWAGIQTSQDDGPTFTCPQQPSLHLPLSRLDDGICDCCDGADEPGTCEDVCDVVLAAERAARAKRESDFLTGSQKRLETLESFRVLRETTLAAMNDVTRKVDDKRGVLKGFETRIEEARMAYLEERRTSLQKHSLEGTGLAEILEPLSNEELSVVIQWTCQLAGELEDAETSETCVPLRLAGVELGVTWNDEDFGEGETDLNQHTDEEGRKLIAKLVERNANGQSLWSITGLESSQKRRRRLDERYDDDPDYYADDDYGYDNYSDDDDDDDEYEREQEKTKPDQKPKEKTELEKMVEGTTFSVPRVIFLQRAQELKHQIEEFLDQKRNQQEEPEEGAEASPGFDSTPYENVKIALTKREKAIQRGFQYAVSGKILMDAWMEAGGDGTENRANLIMLAGLTLLKSKLAVAHVWQMLNMAVADFGLSYEAEMGEKGEGEEQTCAAAVAASPLVKVCPPKTIQKNGVDYPPAFVNEAGEKVCQQLMNDTDFTGCGNTDVEAITFLPDGYFGYHVTYPSTEGDALFALAAALSTAVPAPATKELIDAKNAVEEAISNMERELDELDEKIGGHEQNKYGRYGELLTLKDTCHSVTAGKYDYEVCIFGKAQQKDKGASSGTSLGTWKGASIDEESGMRVFKWEGGQKCWNGPQRSATAYVTCGAETKVVSADEPDTCRYELQMESYIGCDYDYFQKYLS